MCIKGKGVLIFAVQHRTDYQHRSPDRFHCSGLIHQKLDKSLVNTFFYAEYFILDYKCVHILYKLFIPGHQLAIRTTQAYVPT